MKKCPPSSASTDFPRSFSPVAFLISLGVWWLGTAASDAQVDTEAPSVEIVNVGFTKLGTEHYHMEFSILASDNNAVAGLEYRSAVSLGPFGDWKPLTYGGPGSPIEVELFCWAYDFEVRAVDAAGNRSAVDSWSFSEPVVRPIFKGPFQIEGKVGRELRYRIRASASTRYFAIGIPPGLSVNPKTGWITGKPRKPGEYRAFLVAGNSIMTARRFATFKISP